MPQQISPTRHTTRMMMKTTPPTLVLRRARTEAARRAREAERGNVGRELEGFGRVSAL
jgi:hypothetical protein